MNIRKTYIGTLNGTHGIWCGSCPIDAIIKTTKMFLYAEPEHELVDKTSGERMLFIEIKKESDIEKYIEISINKEL